MTLRLSVESGAWRNHIERVATELGDVLPVVKGNGYGFGRVALLPHAIRFSNDVAVGTVYEIGDVPDTMRPFVLMPVGAGVTTAPRRDAVLAVGSLHDLDVLQHLGVKNPVVIKVESSMHRYGVAASEASELRQRAHAAGHEVVAWSLHLPLAGSDDDHVNEAIALAKNLAVDLPLHVSHIGAGVQRLRSAVTHHVIVRTGTHLWLGDKSMISLQTDVIAMRDSPAATAGYRATKLQSGTRLVMVGCGSSHGITEVDNGKSPFHFARERLAMFEAPHMHTTMLCVGTSSSLREGDWVDVQQPLTRVAPDVTEWR